MSDAAPAPGSTSGTAASHVATAEWQSFELRMRRRRAQRCLLRAEVALEAGFTQDAAAALDEARRLSASPDEIDRIERLIDSAARGVSEAPSDAERAPWLGWKHIAAAIAMLAGVTAFDSGALLRDAPPPRQIAPVPPAPIPAPAVSVSVQHVSAAPSAGFAVEESRPEPKPPARAEEPAVLVARAQEPAVLAQTPPVEERAARPDPRELTRASLPPIRALPTGAAPPPRPPVAADPPAAEPSRPMASITPNVAPVPELIAAPVRDEAADVRAILSQYETAYSQLDPARARAVWPSVDERALSRAFGSLESQQVSLGRCDVTLTGATARATCAGSTTWRPKVGGGGARTDARRWTFELKKSGETWRIERAVTR